MMNPESPEGASPARGQYVGSALLIVLVVAVWATWWCAFIQPMRGESRRLRASGDQFVESLMRRYEPSWKVPR